MISPWFVLFVSSYFGGLVLALRHPIFPMVAYLAFYYMPPHVNWWGRFLPDLRYSMLAAAVLGVSVFMHHTSEPLKEEKNPALPWMVLLGLNAMVVSTWALDQVRNWTWATALLKLVLIYVLIPGAVRTPVAFDTFGAVHVAGATFWGYKAWDSPTRSAGRLEEVGGPDTQNDNQAAAHLLTVMPFAALYALTLRRRFPRVFAVIAAAFIVNVFILCNSRGATLGLVGGGIASIFLAGKGRRKKLIGVGLAGVVGLLLLADPDYITRQQTTVDPQDGSAQSRLAMWQAGYEMMQDYPLGAGGRAFHVLSPRYLPALVARQRVDERSSHNTYIQLGTDWGIQGIVLWCGFMAATLLLLHRIRRRAPDNQWYFYRALAIEVGLIGTLTAAFFSNRLYGESIYWLCALAVALHRIQSTELAGITAESVPNPYEEAQRVRHAAARAQEAPAG